MQPILLECGCQAYSTKVIDGVPTPSCFTHGCQTPAEVEPDLTGRNARCSCGNKRPSTDSADGRLAFFEYRGPGSRESREICKCGYAQCAHDSEHMAKNVSSNRKTVVELGYCKGFELRGPNEFDGYYCGCRGWE